MNIELKSFHFESLNFFEIVKIRERSRGRASGMLCGAERKTNYGKNNKKINKLLKKKITHKKNVHKSSVKKKSGLWPA